MKLRNSFKKTVILLLFYLPAAPHSHAQNKPPLELGVKLMAEANRAYGSTMPLTGIQLIYQKGKHGGLETGLYYRAHRIETSYSFYDPSIGFYSGSSRISVRFLSLPVLYRFQSKIINFTAGSSFDLFTGWKDKSKKGNVVVTQYNRSNTIMVGAVASVSKSIPLGNQFIIEPEIRFNPILTDGDPYTTTAFGFAFRYKLN